MYNPHLTPSLNVYIINCAILLNFSLTLSCVMKIKIYIPYAIMLTSVLPFVNNYIRALLCKK